MTTFSNVVFPLLRVITVCLALCVATTAMSFSAMAAQDASMHEVYQAAEQGYFTEAQGMMGQVRTEQNFRSAPVNDATFGIADSISWATGSSGGDDCWD